MEMKLYIYTAYIYMYKIYENLKIWKSSVFDDDN